MQSLISAEVNYGHNTSFPFVHYTAKAIHTRSSCLVGCARILRYMLGVYPRAITTSSLPRTETSATLRNPQKIHVITDQTFMLLLQQRSLTTSRRKPVAQEMTLAFAFKLSNCKVRSVLIPIDTLTLHGRQQFMPTIAFVLHVPPNSVRTRA